MSEAKDVREKLIGKRVLILSPHPHAGEIGMCIDVRKTMFGDRPVVKSDSGEEFFVMKPTEWKILDGVYVCDRCGRPKAHFRLKGLKCLTCD